MHVYENNVVLRRKEILWTSTFFPSVICYNTIEEVIVRGWFFTNIMYIKYVHNIQCA